MSGQPNRWIILSCDEPVGVRRLVLADELFRDDVIIFDEVRSRCVTYGADDGPRIEVRYPDAPYLGIWAEPHANFICIEPWHSVADPADFAGARVGI